MRPDQATADATSTAPNHATRSETSAVTCCAMPPENARKAFSLMPFTPVMTGISSDSDQEIVSGLVKGETVIFGPFRVLRNMGEGDEVEETEVPDKKNDDNAVSVEISD